MNSTGDKTIINGIISGDDAIIKAFYKKYLPQVSNYIVKNSGSISDAEDIFQDAMVFVYQKLKSDSLELNCSLGTYVYAVSRNMWMNKLRKNNRMVNNEDIITISGIDESDLIEDIYAGERRTLYQKYFLKLGESCQELLALFFSGASMREISNKKGYTEAYTRKKKFECKKKLMAMVEKDPAFDELKTPQK